MQTAKVMVTAIHERGFGFGIRADDGESVFIPPYLMQRSKAVEDDLVGMILVPNERYARQPWKASGLIKLQAPSRDMLAKVRHTLNDKKPWTLDDLARHIDADEDEVLMALEEIEAVKFVLSWDRNRFSKTYWVIDTQTARDIIEGEG